METCDEKYIAKEEPYFKKQLNSMVKRSLAGLNGFNANNRDFVDQEVEDLFTEFSLRAHKAAHKYDPEFTGVGAPEHRCRNWLLTICKYTVRTWKQELISSRKREVSMDGVADDAKKRGRDGVESLDNFLVQGGWTSMSIDPAHVVQEAQPGHQIRKVCRCLSKRRLEMLQMWESNCDDSEIATALKCSEEVVRAERSRSHKQIKTSIELLERRADLDRLTGLSDERRQLLATAVDHEFDPEAMAKSLGISEIEVIARLPSAITRAGTLIATLQGLGEPESE